MGKKRVKSRGRRVKGSHLFVALIFTIALLAVFGDRGLMDVLKLRGERDVILNTNKALEGENSLLETKIALLKKDRRYIGQIARDELGMIGRNEIIYRFRDDQ